MLQLPALVQRTQREQEALAAEARAPHARAPALLHRLGHLIRHRKWVLDQGQSLETGA